MIIVPILLPILAIFCFGGFHSLSPKAPKGVFEKNEKGLKTPLSFTFHKKPNLRTAQKHRPVLPIGSVYKHVIVLSELHKNVFCVY